ncbi:MAG: phosphatase PAP2 family protein [Mangrovibacterium sp.]
MNTKQSFAYAVSAVFHPLVIPTLAYLLLMNSGFYFALLPFQAKKVIIMVVFLSTFLLPLISIILMGLHTRIKPDLDKSSERVIPMLSAAVFYYVGYYALGRLEIYPVFKVFLISSILIIVILMLVSVRWKISAHMAAIGGLIGIFTALSLRLGTNNSPILAVLIAIAGLVGSSRLILGKHTPLQIYAGFFAGFAVNYLIIHFI